MSLAGLASRAERGRLIDKVLQVDGVFCLTLILIAGAGALMMFSIAGSSWEPWAANHLTRFGVAFVLMLALAVIDLRVWAAIAYPLYGIGLILLIAVELIGDVRLGAQRWLDLGPLGSFQPSEIMKLGLVLALGRFYHGLSAERARLSWWLLIPAAMIGAPTLLVAHQPDLGTAVLLALTGLTVVILAGLSWKIIFAGAGLILASLPPFILFVLHDYQRQRILTFMNPEGDPSGTGYHILQSKIALGSGGLLGKGYGLGSQSQLNFLPEKQTDFIFTVVGEELGFAGSAVLLALYGVMILRIWRVGSTAPDLFGTLICTGVLAMIMFQVFESIGMSTGIMPITGIPLPFFSYGGSSVLASFLGIGLVQSVHLRRMR